MLRAQLVVFFEGLATIIPSAFFRRASVPNLKLLIFRRCEPGHVFFRTVSVPKLKSLIFGRCETGHVFYRVDAVAFEVLGFPARMKSHTFFHICLGFAGEDVVSA